MGRPGACPSTIGRWCTGNISDSESEEHRSIRWRSTSAQKALPSNSAWCTGNISGFEPEEARSLRAAEICELGSVDTGMSRSLENCRGRVPLGVRFPPLPLELEIVGPVAQRQEQLPYKQTNGGSSPPGITYCRRSPTEGGVSLRTRTVLVRIQPPVLVTASFRSVRERSSKV
jgi:hypothetical protein